MTDKLTSDIKAALAKSGSVLGGIAGSITNKNPGLGMQTRVDDVRRISSNVLSNYMLVQYHFALTMLSVEGGTVVQDKLAKSPGTITSINIDEDLRIDRQRADKSVTIASTGETKRNFVNIDVATKERVATDPAMTVLDVPKHFDITESIATYDTSAWNYYNIESVSMQNYLAPTSNNPAVAEMLTMKMRLIEPHGFKFVEDLRLIANNLGWEYAPSTRVIYRIDLWFSGYDAATGAWVENIPFKSDYGTTELQALSYFANIAMVSAKMDGRGAVYEIDFVPCGHQAWRPEDIVFDSLTVAQASGDTTFGNFLDTLQDAMEKTRLRNTDSKIKRKYRFFAPDVIRSAQFNQTKFFSKKNMLSSGGGTVSSSKTNLDIIKLVEEAWIDCDKIQDLFLRDGEDNIKFLDPRVMLAFEFNTLYSVEGAPNTKPPTNTKINDYDTVYHQYKIVPYITFAKGITTEDTVKDYVDPQNQIARIKAMVTYGMLQRVYDYIYTGNNTEVLNLDLTFQNFFHFQALWPTGVVSSPAGSGIGTSATSGALTQASQSGTIGTSGLQISGLRDDAVDQVLKQVFGQVNLASAGSGQNGNPFQRLAVGNTSMNTLPYPDLLEGALSSESPVARASKYLYYRNDYLQRDMLVIDLEIRGDPIWLMSAYTNASLSSLNPLAHAADKEVVIVPKTDRVLFLRLFAPIQDDYMNPNRASGSSHPLIIGGFYQVLLVENTFAQGKFTQKLRCRKYDHLNYIEQFTEKGYGKLFLIPPGADSPNQGPASVRPGAGPVPTTNPAGPAVPDTGTIIRAGSGGANSGFPVFAPSNPDAGSPILGLKGNNPGNIAFKGGNFDGTVGQTTTNPAFGIYDSPQRGVQNMMKNLEAYNRQGMNTIYQIIMSWCPPDPRNDTQAYLARASAAMGVPLRQKVDFSDKEFSIKFIYFIIGQEVGNNNRYTKEFIRTSLGW